MAHTELPRRGPLKAPVSAMRPRQWIKNGLIVVAPAAAGVITHASVIRHTVAAFLAFCCVSSAMYLFNDLRDIESDRQHPTKQFRAIPSGQLPFGVAKGAAVLLLAVGFAIPFALWHPEQLFLVLGLYVLITVSYIVWLKNVVIELASVASGFILRAYAGAAASHIFVSTWFLVVISFGALFLVVGKRSSELENRGAGATRKVLSQYSPAFLHSALTLSATVVVTGYCLWAFDTSSTGLSSIHHDLVPIRLSVITVVLAVLFIIRSSESADAEAPEDLLLHNRIVQVLFLLWALALALGTYT